MSGEAPQALERGPALAGEPDRSGPFFEVGGKLVVPAENGQELLVAGHRLERRQVAGVGRSGSGGSPPALCARSRRRLSSRPAAADSSFGLQSTPAV